MSCYDNDQVNYEELVNGFHLRLIAFLDKVQWSQAKLARKMGVSNQTVATYVLGRGLPNAIMLKKLAIATGISADWWLGLCKTKKTSSTASTASLLR